MRAAGLGPLLGRMRRSLTEGRARAISAPQLGASLRVFLIAASTPNRPPLAVLNPRLLRAARARTVEWEACLSVPDHYALVRRPRSVEVVFETLGGDSMRRVLTGDVARVFQHELDHLDGILYTDRMFAPSFAHESTLRSKGRRAALEKLQRLHDRQHEGHWIATAVGSTFIPTKRVFDVWGA